MRLAGLLVVLAACGAARKSAPPAPASAEPPDAHAQIEALDRQIADELRSAQLAVPAAACAGSCATAVATPFAVPALDDAACHPAPSPTCTDACNLSSSVCTNQQKLCDLAAQLAGDDWAAGKCASARESCKTTRDRCCSCV